MVLRQFTAQQWEDRAVGALIVGVAFFNLATCLAYFSFQPDWWVFTLALVVAAFFVVRPVFGGGSPLPGSDDKLTPSWHWLWLLIPWGAWAWFRYRAWGMAPIWLDEYAHIMEANLYDNPFRRSFYNQQPPAGYILSAGLQLVTGISKTTARLTGFLPCLVASLFATLWALRRGGVGAALVTVAFLAWDPRFLFHSLEGRSMGTALAWIFPCLMTGEALYRHPSRGRQVLFAACLFCLLMTVGLQTPLLMGLFTGFALLLGLASGDRALLKMVPALAVALLLFVPVQLAIMGSSQAYMLPWSMDRLTTSLKNLGWQTLEPYYMALDAAELRWWWWAMVAAGLSALWLKRRVPALWAFGLTLLVFPPVFHVVYHQVVILPVMTRYYDLWRLLAYVMMGVAPLFLLRDFWRAGLAGVLLAVFTVGSFHGHDPLYTYEWVTNWRQDWGPLYRHLEHPRFRDVKFHLIGPCLPGDWCMNFFVNREVYAPSDHLRPRLNDHIEPRVSEFYQDNGMIMGGLAPDHHRRALVIPVFKFWVGYNYEEILASDDPQVRVERVGDFLILEAVRSKDPATILEFMHRNLRPEGIYTWPRETLMRLAIMKGDWAAAQRWWDVMRSFPDWQSAQDRSYVYRRKMEYLAGLLEQKKGFP